MISTKWSTFYLNTLFETWHVSQRDLRELIGWFSLGKCRLELIDEKDENEGIVDDASATDL